MVNSALKRIYFRSLKNYSVQLISITIMLILGITIFIGLDSTWRSLDNYIHSAYKKENTAELEIYSSPVAKGSFEDVKTINGVKEIEERMVVVAELPEMQSTEVQVNAISEKPTISQYTLTEGKHITKENDCILDESFAEENNLTIGDEIKLQVNNVEKTFTIKGLALSSSYIYQTPDSTTVIPNHKKYGFVFVNLEDAKAFTSGQEMTNKVLINIDHQSSLDQVKDLIEKENFNQILGIVKREETLNDLAISQKIAQYQSIGKLFPIVFFAIVILMSFTTMYRIMNKERQTIGIFKSLGYSSNKVLFHYLSYSFWISTIGITLGTLIGWKVVPPFIWKFFRELFIFQDVNIVLSAKQVLIVTILSIGSTCISTLVVYLKMDKEQPASLMREQVTFKGKHILLEKLGTFWSKLKPSSQLTLRQMFKNKVRMFMTIFGVIGCTSLLLSSLGIKDTINEVATSVYGETYLYKEKLELNAVKIDKEFYQTFDKEKSAELLEERVLPISSKSKNKLGTVHILEENSTFMKFSVDTKETSLTNQEVLITEKTAEIFSLKKGDTIQIRIGDQKKIELKINKIAKLSIGQGIYLTKETWENQDQTFYPTSVIRGKSDIDYPEGVIKKVIQTQNQEDDFLKSMSSTISMSMLLIFAAVSLAIITLYNLGNLNFTDRERDLATLSVLGFYDKELKKLLSTENVLLSIGGVLLGIPAGIMIHQKIFEDAGMGDELDFTAVISQNSFIITVIFTFILMILVNLILNRKIRKIKMTEALKSVD